MGRKKIVPTHPPAIQPSVVAAAEQKVNYWYVLASVSFGLLAVTLGYSFLKKRRLA